jgi:L-asparaginase
MLAAAERAIAAGIPVVLASRCPAGAVGTAYAFPGGGATWVRAGAIPTGTLCAIKTRVAVALGLGAGLDRDGLAALLADPTA